MQHFSLDNYVVDVLMPDLVGHDRRPATFIVYLYFLRHAAKGKRDTLSVSLQTIATKTGRGLGKGQIKQPDEAYVYLGRYWIAQNEPKEAKNAFTQLKTLTNISPRVLRLWDLYADTIPEARSASL